MVSTSLTLPRLEGAASSLVFLDVEVMAVAKSLFITFACVEGASTVPLDDVIKWIPSLTYPEAGLLGS